MNKTSRIYVAGHRGLVGSAIVRRLREQGYENVLTRPREKLDLRHAESVDDFFDEYRPQFAFLAAAKVGGILANRDRPADFIDDNLAIQRNVISACPGVDTKLCFLGSSCIYPRDCPQPIKEEYLMTGPLEPTNSAYAMAKLAGLEMVKAYAKQYGLRAVCPMPCNLYGPGDNYDPLTSHVLPAMIAKFHEAKENNRKSVTLWGTGTPRREFLYVDDLADACIMLMGRHESAEPINVGTGADIAIRELAQVIKVGFGYTGEIVWDSSKPDGTPQKLLDASRINAMGWRASTDLYDGIVNAYADYKQQLDAYERHLSLEVCG